MTPQFGNSFEGGVEKADVEHRNVACARDDVIDKAKERIETNLLKSLKLVNKVELLRSWKLFA